MHSRCTLLRQRSRCLSSWHLTSFLFTRLRLQSLSRLNHRLCSCRRLPPSRQTLLCQNRSLFGCQTLHQRPRRLWYPSHNRCRFRGLFPRRQSLRLQGQRLRNSLPCPTRHLSPWKHPSLDARSSQLCPRRPLSLSSQGQYLRTSRCSLRRQPSRWRHVPSLRLWCRS
jgi:hypothetical protein